MNINAQSIPLCGCTSLIFISFFPLAQLPLSFPIVLLPSCHFSLNVVKNNNGYRVCLQCLWCALLCAFVYMWVITYSYFCHFVSWDTESNVFIIDSGYNRLPQWVTDALDPAATSCVCMCMCVCICLCERETDCDCDCMQCMCFLICQCVFKHHCEIAFTRLCVFSVLSVI